MKRSTLCAATPHQAPRRPRIIKVYKPFLLLLLAGPPSCFDGAANPVVPTSGAPIPAAPPGTPVPNAGSGGVLLDSAVLRSLSSHKVGLGERVLIAADSANAHAVRDANITVRDTAVIGVDGEGMLYALQAGKTWVTWSSGDGVDSASVTVALNEGESDQPTYVAPAPPKAFVDVRYPTPRARGGATGKSWKVAAGQDLQSVLNEAQPGDEIVLASGSTFTGNFVLPPKQSSGTDWIIVRAEAVGVAAGTRMSPALAASAARIITPNQNPALFAGAGSRRWRLVGFQIEHAQNGPYNYGIVVLGAGNEKALDQQPSDIVFDRMYIHGSTTVGNSRCMAFNGRSLAVIDSWLSECHAKGNDSQGIGGWNGAGPFLIENNFIEGAGQGIMFGGADPVIKDVSPSDIIIRRNYIFKPLTWGKSVWTVKAAFELKHARRVLFEGNVIENHWIDAQAGYAVLFQTLSDNNSAWEWTTVSDVMVRNNVIKNSAGGADIVGRVAYSGGPLPTNPTSRIAVVNNLWQEVGQDPIAGTVGRAFMLLGDHHDVTLVNNTVTSPARVTVVLMMDGNPAVSTTITNNVFPNSEYGFYGSTYGTGASGIQFYLPGSVVNRNVIPGQASVGYPGSNFFPTTGASLQGALPDKVCELVAVWANKASVPAGIGADCDGVTTAVRNVVTPP